MTSNPHPSTDAAPTDRRGPRVALVTGGNSGIGYATAQQRLAHGLRVWIGARDLGRGRAAAEALGAGAQAVQLDVTDADSIAAAATRVGALDVLVNNAGVSLGFEGIDTMTPEQLRRTYDTNVFGLIAVTQAFLPALRRSDRPRIVNVSSGTGSLTWSSGPNPQFDWERVAGGALAYRTSKAAVDAVTLLTAQALGSRFKVNALAPGLRATRATRGLAGAGDPAEGAAGAVRLALLPDTAPTGALWSWDGTIAPW